MKQPDSKRISTAC